jgi:RNA polymerase sigma-70 factor (ECF subfamily)
MTMATTTFDEACVGYLPDLRRFARRLAPDRPAADDLTQDTMLRALANRHRFTPGTNLRAWLFTIMKNQRINGARRAHRQGVAAELSEITETVDGGQETNQQIQELRRALEKLPAGKREIVMLAHYQELPYDEIADRLKIPEGTVRSRLVRVRRRLRESLEA